MFDIVLKKTRHIREYHIHRMEINVVFDKSQLFHYFENLNEPPLFIRSLYQQVDTNDPKGGATYCDLAYVIRGWISNYLIQYIDMFNIHDNDFDYIFRHGENKKEIAVSFIISTYKLRYLSLKHPDFYNKIKPSQLSQEYISNV